MTDHLKPTVDVLAAGTTVAVIADWLPKVAALFTILWYAVRLWETETVRKLTGRL